VTTKRDGTNTARRYGSDVADCTQGERDMAGLNNVKLIGNLGKDPELKNNGKNSWCDLNIAVNQRRKVGDNWEDKVEWVAVRVLGKGAENCAKYLTKGRSVFVDGRLETSSWVDEKTKEKKYMTRVVSFDVQFLGGGGEGKPGGGSKPSSGAPESAPADDDDLPF
jgi:single-strand DNA-binding protein